MRHSDWNASVGTTVLWEARLVDPTQHSAGSHLRHCPGHTRPVAGVTSWERRGNCETVCVALGRACSLSPTQCRQQIPLADSRAPMACRRVAPRC